MVTLSIQTFKLWKILRSFGYWCEKIILTLPQYRVINLRDAVEPLPLKSASYTSRQSVLQMAALPKSNAAIIICGLHIFLKEGSLYRYVVQKSVCMQIRGCRLDDNGCQSFPKCSKFYKFDVLTKGQLISKGLCGVIVWTKKPTKFFKDFCPSL